MVHAIHEGRAVFGRNQPAWHREGVVLPGLLTALEVMQHVDPPRIDTIPTFYPIYDEEGNIKAYAEADGFGITTATYSDGRIVPLGQVGIDWKPVQFDAAFRIFDPIIKDMGAVFDAAGVLNGGKIFWSLAHLPEPFTLSSNPKDTSHRYLLFTTKNDGTGSVIVKVVWIRVVCANTLAVALGNKKGEIRIRHSGDVDAKIEDAVEIIEDAWESFKEGEKNFELMAERTVKPEERKALISGMLGWTEESWKNLSQRGMTLRENVLNEIEGVFLNGFGASELGHDQSLWHTFNTLTEYLDHNGRIKSTTSKLSSMIDGDIDKKKRFVYKTAVKMLADGTEVEELVAEEVEESNGGAADFGDLMDMPSKVV